ncbi:hypothetical protein [Alkalilimnicola sp. S0819]|uniref:hypothetical protein n=1 Tax=Alkalilimnicola sp. S0819 TaxID=2613922 RepID=UPI001261DBF8|nr:hypothetical protein [Alkalilimnicola sp. S0819]KAB7628190.1 hypothetical protein F3N43_00310 [Alkalilimnicola sp. S0819]MPQ15079.1 hypothetical protein [Alkalilimnicola sp. S0819]
MRLPLACTFLAALALGLGCENPANDDLPASPDTALGWDEYVAKERPLREPYTWQRYYRQGLPDMRRWRPEDFLPAEYLRAEHVRFCELPVNERRALSDVLSNSLDEEGATALRHYAERGVLTAQTTYGAFCRAGGPGFSADEAVDWARRAGASGDPDAMTKLGLCLDDYLEGHDVHTKSFLADEILYWHWRGAKYLQRRALMAMFIFTGNQFYEYAELGANDIHAYKWDILEESIDALHGIRHDPETMSLTGKAYPYNAGMTPEQIARSRELARGWLLENADSLKDLPLPFNCADDPDAPYAGGSYDYALFNETLQVLGLHFDTATRVLEITGPVATTPP